MKKARKLNKREIKFCHKMAKRKKIDWTLFSFGIELKWGWEVDPADFRVAYSTDLENRFTTCAIFTPKGLMYQGSAKRIPCDRPVKRIGRNVALKRALVASPVKVFDNGAG
jgi:hypothetical protein